MLNNQEIIAKAKEVFNNEIDGLNKVSAKIDAVFADVVKLILNCTGKVVVSGMGKSGHIGNKIAATLASTGTPAFFVHPAEALHGDLGMISKNDVFIAISYSGESDELAVIIPILKNKGVSIVGITGKAKSTLAKKSNHALITDIGKEACPLNLAPTTSTTVTLVLGDALAVTLLSLRNFNPEDFAMSHPGGSLGKRLLTKVDDIMCTSVDMPCLLANAKITEIVSEISSKGFGVVCIIDSSNKLQGIITDADLRKAFEKDVYSLSAKDIMNSNPKILKQGDMAVQAIDLVDKYDIRAFVVTDVENSLVGVFHLQDLLRAKLL